MEHTHFFLKEVGFNGTFDEVVLNLRYLNEHQLTESAVAAPTLYKDEDDTFEQQVVPGGIMVKGRITAKGIDFLENDGGLTAILGVVTVKLHSETLSALEGKILASDEIPPEEKTRLLDRLRSLPEEGAKTLVQEMIKAGLNRGPEVWETALRYLSG